MHFVLGGQIGEFVWRRIDGPKRGVTEEERRHFDVDLVFVLVDCEVCAAGSAEVEGGAGPGEGTVCSLGDFVVGPVFAFCLGWVISIVEGEGEG